MPRAKISVKVAHFAPPALIDFFVESLKSGDSHLISESEVSLVFKIAHTHEGSIKSEH